MKRMISVILIAACFGILVTGAAAQETAVPGGPYGALHVTSGRAEKAADGIARISQQDEYGSPLVVNTMQKNGVDWSADGEWIAYEEEGNIYVISSNGGTPTLVTPTIGGYSYLPRFTPDSNAISFTNYDSFTESFAVMQVYFRDKTLPYEIILYDALAHAFNSDGKLIVYRIASTSELALYNSITDNTRILAPGDYDDSLGLGYGSSCFSPDDSHIVTGMVNSEGGMTLYAIPTAGGDPLMLTEIDYEIHNFPDYSPDGRWILFTDDYWGDLQAYDTESGDWYQVYPGTDYLNVFGRFSPDGQNFVYLLDEMLSTDSVYDVYIAPFTMGSSEIRSVTLLYPEGGDYLTGGDWDYIEWESSAIASVRLEFSSNGGSSWTLIEEGILATSGGYDWNVPQLESSLCQIRISSMSGDVDDYSGYFTIETAGEPAASLYAPTSGESLTAGGNYHIQWDASHVDTVRLEYSIDNGSFWREIANNLPAGDGGYDWNVPTQESTDCLIRITMSDGAVLDETGVFSISAVTAEPYLDLVTPSGGEQWQAGTQKDIVWMTNLTAVTIWYSTDNKSTWNLIVKNYSTDTASTTQSYAWEVPNTPSQTCYIRINDENDTDIVDMNRTPFTITEPSTTFKPELLYSFDTGYPIFLSSPVIDQNGVVYIANLLNEVFAVRPDGTLKWSTFFDDISLTESTEIWASPVLQNGSLYIGSMNGYFYALNALDGSRKWSYNAKASIISSAAVAYDGSIYFATNTGSFIGLNPDGTRKFTPVDLGTPVLSSPAIGIDGTVYLGGLDGVVYAFTTDGYLKWEFTTGRETIYSSPAIGSDGTIYIATSSGNDTTSDGYLYALSSAGTYKWSTAIGTSAISSPAIGADGTIYIGSSATQSNVDIGRLYAINPKDGSVRWTVTADTEIPSTPLVATDGTIYVGTNVSNTAGNILALAPDGAVKWKYQTGGYIASSPAIGTDGQLYVGSYDGLLYAVQGYPGTTLAVSNWPKFRRNQANTGRVTESAISFIRVTSPDGGETFKPGDTTTITWNSRNVTQVRIELSIDGGGTFSEIGIAQAATSSFTWNVSTTQATGDECLIRLTDTTNNIVTDESNDYFAITQDAFVEVLKPEGGEQFRVGTTQMIKWGSNAIDKLDISYSTDGGSNWILIATEVPGMDGQYQWMVPDAVSSNCMIRIMQTGNEELADVSNGVFAIVSDTFIEVTAPSFGDKWAAGSVREITWTFNGPTTVKIELSIDNGATWETITASTPALTGSYPWTVPTTESDNCFIRITDTGNAATFDSSPQFAIATPVLSIQHIPIAHANETQAITFTAQVTSTAAIDTVTLHWDVTGDRQFTTHTLVMENVNNNTYRCVMELGTFTAEGVEYYIRARDEDKRVARTPDAGFYSIVADISNINSEQTVAGGSAENAYRMISVPMDLTATTMAQQMKDTQPAGENGTGWRLFWYDASVASETDRYQEFIPGVSGPGGFEPGKAFWLITTSNFRLSALSGSTVSTAEPYTIILQSGWNDIANPWMFDISWENIENPSGADLSVLYEYNGTWSNPLNPPTVLKPWHGYAVLNNTNRNVVIKLNPTPAGTGKLAASAQQNSQLAATKPSAETGWLLKLDATAGGATDLATYFGVTPGALDGKDLYDHVEPPVIGNYVTVAFPHPDWDDTPRAYTVDMRPTDAGPYGWAFDVSTTVEQEPVTVTVNGIESLPDGMGVAITDRDTGLPVALSGDAFSFLSGHELTERHYTLTVDTIEQLEQRGLTTQPVAFLTARCFPNPFNPATTIRYALPSLERVRIEIYNALGQRIREFVLGSREAGVHEYYFDAVGLTSGVYFYRVSAGAQVVTDKMLLMK